MGGVSFPMMLPNIMKFKIFLISCQPNGLWMLFNWIWVTSLGFCRDRENNNKGCWLWKTGFNKKKASRELQRSWKWFTYFLFYFYCNFTRFINLAYAKVVCVCVFYFGEAKRQRMIQVMDIHEIPKPKNAFFGKNKGGSGGGSHGKHWWLNTTNHTY